MLSHSPFGLRVGLLAWLVTSSLTEVSFGAVPASANRLELAKMCSAFLGLHSATNELRGLAAQMAERSLNPSEGKGWGLLSTRTMGVFPEAFATSLFDLVDNPAELSSNDIPLGPGTKPYGTLSGEDADSFRSFATKTVDGLNDAMAAWGESVEILRIDLRKARDAGKLPGQGFHVDEGYATLLVTFQGMGTEIAIKEGNGARRFTVEPMDLVFLTGKLRMAAFPHQPGALPTIHRAPPSGSRRLVLVIHLQPKLP